MSEERKFNAITEAAKKALGLTDDRLRWVAFDVIATLADGTRQLKITIGIYPEVYKSGKRKGRTNFKKPLERHEVVVTDKDIEAAKEAYERETGKCSRCLGTGEELYGFGASGEKYRPCKRCAASGSAFFVAPEPAKEADQ